MDLNRLVHDANPPVPVHDTGARAKRVFSAVINTQDLTQRIPSISQATKGQRLITFSNRQDVIQGSFKVHVYTRRPEFEDDILTNIPIGTSLNTPRAAKAFFRQSGDAWDALESLIGTIDGPSDWASQHDHYLYDTPKR